ncbi:tetratricopeptide repeat protein [Pedobacter endophyticus]|uniref:Tetratricopeptide repeat-containing protein n=1 Tax=Pedobacter endophyticus TaxID=2789740 RepID=A0A7S9Q067_9SPHI|nr:tetratricopeptide repeat protein [Pedobacter endophyticus]QPH41078.1 hypothetical protein IZT61_07405 [Pedobacter endophyticus]
MKNILFIFLFSIIYLGGYTQESPSIDKEKLFDLYQTQRYAEAGDYLKGAYGDETSDLKALTQIGYCFLMAGNNVEAEKFYAKAYALQPQSLPILFSLANISTKRGNSAKAKLFYGEIAKIDSNNFNVFKLLANLYTQDSVKLVYLLKANQINPKEGDVASDLAEVYSTYQDYETAYRVLDVAIQADSENLVLQRAKLPIANQLKKYSEVIASGERLLKDETDAAVVKDVAKAYYFTKQYQKAINLFKVLESLAMQNEATLYYTALSYRGLNNLTQSAIYTKKTIDEAVSPNISSYYVLLGLVYQENKQAKLAAGAFKKGLQFAPNPTLYYRLAILYDTKLNQQKTALTYYKLFMKSKPKAKDEKEEIAYTEARIAQLQSK